MRFWDSSAVVPLVVRESESAKVAVVLDEDKDLTLWWGSRVECISALRRREREGSLADVDLARAVDLLNELTATSHEVLASEELRTVAERSLAVHGLRAAAAFQLAAAVVWRGPGGGPDEFVCLDDRLRSAASREGFRLLPA